MLLSIVLAVPARAQLISPGKLTAVHAGLEGITNCTSCHQLGQRGIDPAKCLDCHTPLRNRIRRDEGFHANVSQACATCHKEHFGRDFDAVRLDERAFDHRETGYPLTGEHRRVDCESCHQPAFITAADVRAYQARAGRLEETFLGVADDCQTCHRDDNPHGAGFERNDCAACHSTAGWDEADTRHFDHAATGFALVGAHATLACTSCHAGGAGDGIPFTGLESTCASCHRADDPHGGQFRGQDCASCHDARTWGAAPRFNHDRTAFPLTGQHRRVDCAACHGPVSGRTRFDAAEFDTCASCHEDAHAGAMGGDCATCHTTAGWGQMSRSFDEDRFDHAATGFTLVGAHAALDCTGCHATPARDDAGIRITFAEDPRGATFPAVVADHCLSCHKDFHAGAFSDLPDGPLCASCHGQGGWLPTTFDIERHNAETAFPLTGGHLATPCFACHGGGGGEPPHFAFESTACEACHADLNPHGDEFADDAGVTACGGCHATDAWDLAAFDHAQTGFPLLGAHAALACQTCHTPTTTPDGRTVHRFTGLDAACATCHADDDPHRGQFEGASCDTCHDTAAFTIAAFDHTQTRFPLDGAHARVACGSCHRTEEAPTGEPFVRFKPLGTACADCHGGG